MKHMCELTAVVKQHNEAGPVFVACCALWHCYALQCADCCQMLLVKLPLLVVTSMDILSSQYSQKPAGKQASITKYKQT